MKSFTLVHFDNNPRHISRDQFERLQKTMHEYGDLSGIIINLKEQPDGKTVGELVGGNQRSEAAQFLTQKPIIEQEYKKPLADGTVARGYFDLDGKHFACRFVRWDAEKALNANLIANAAGGAWDWDLLANIPPETLSEVGFDDEMLKNIKVNAKALDELIESQITSQVEFREYDERTADGVKLCKCKTCGHEHAAKKDK